MRRFILALVLIIASAAAGSDYVVAQSQDSDFKTRTRVVGDSIRSKGTRLGKKVARGTEVVIDSVGAKAPRWGKKVAEKSEVVVDSIGAKAPRWGKKGKRMADTLKVRSKRTWKKLKE